MSAAAHSDPGVTCSNHMSAGMNGKNEHGNPADDHRPAGKRRPDFNFFVAFSQYLSHLLNPETTLAAINVHKKSTIKDKIIISKYNIVKYNLLSCEIRHKNRLHL